MMTVTVVATPMLEMRHAATISRRDANPLCPIILSHTRCYYCKRSYARFSRVSRRSTRIVRGATLFPVIIAARLLIQLVFYSSEPTFKYHHKPSVLSGGTSAFVFIGGDPANGYIQWVYIVFEFTSGTLQDSSFDYGKNYLIITRELVK